MLGSPALRVLDLPRLRDLRCQQAALLRNVLLSKTERRPRSRQTYPRAPVGLHRPNRCHMITGEDLRSGHPRLKVIHVIDRSGIGRHVERRLQNPWLGPGTAENFVSALGRSAFDRAWRETPIALAR